MMTRTVEDVTTYDTNASNDLIPIGRGVTHYRSDWVDGTEGGRPPRSEDDEVAGIYTDLVAAGLPPTVRVTLLSDSEPDVLDVSILLDDTGGWAAAVDAVVSAHLGGI